MDKKSHIALENQEALINDKKFNRVFEEYIDRDLSKYASKLTGDYWISLIGVYDILNSDIEDFDLCNNFKKEATLHLLKSQEDEENILSALKGSTDEFVDTLIYNHFADTKSQVFYKYLSPFLLGILLTLLLNLPFVFLGLVFGKNPIYSKGYVYFSIEDFTVFACVFAMANPFILSIRQKIEDRLNPFAAYASLMFFALFIASFFLGLCNFISRFAILTLRMPLMIYLSLIVVFLLSNYYVYKKIL